MVRDEVPSPDSELLLQARGRNNRLSTLRRARRGRRVARTVWEQRKAQESTKREGAVRDEHLDTSSFILHPSGLTDGRPDNGTVVARFRVSKTTSGSGF